MAETSTIHSSNSLNPSRTASQTYRAFFVARNGRILGMVPLEARSEKEARLAASGLAGEDIVELWVGLRNVARFEHQAG